MPELPEVETIVADLRPHLVGRTILRAELNFPTIVRHPEPEEFIDAVVGMRIDSLGRRGKYILCRLEPSPGSPIGGQAWRARRCGRTSRSAQANWSRADSLEFPHGRQAQEQLRFRR